MCASALDALAFDRRDSAAPGQAELEANVGFGPAAVGDEGSLAAEHDAHGATGAARQQRRDQFHIQALGATAEAAANERLDDTDLRHVHVQDLRQHQVHVIRHLGTGVHGQPVACNVVIGDCRMHLHLVLANLGAIVGRLAHEHRFAEALGYVAELEGDIALEIAGLALVDEDGAGRHGGARREVGRQLAHLHRDEADGLFRRCLVDGGDGCHGLALVAHLVAGEWILAARNRQHAEAPVAILAGNDGDHARQHGGLGAINLDDLSVRVRAAKDATREHLGLEDIGRILGTARHLFGPVYHGQVGADGPHRAMARDLTHGVGAFPVASSPEACWTASMIFT